jgi:hypothetical protein
MACLTGLVAKGFVDFDFEITCKFKRKSILEMRAGAISINIPVYIRHALRLEKIIHCSHEYVHS